MVDNFCQSLAQKERRRPGPDASLSPSEVVTLAIFARWGRFASERDFYRYADAYLRNAFPTLPNRWRFNRLVRLGLELIEETALCTWRRFWALADVPTKPSAELRDAR